ncbi:phenylacetate-coenzyme A ligase PaaK-like adenylate-forming protein [Sinomonas atrocyanea]|uniref:phenylacetate--CoA ligase family protein n=1 Tax=Sinomonas atrocyanea TaxID=37927 RepID=UPI00277D8710|nr:AMP-binding protein [Sinomonas atrocyanea]MDP9884838.1 phenylacetate-coenzyme A ligase PaaK-like adenylate-forming protein [Sinomonas atrocyanea]
MRRSGRLTTLGVLRDARRVLRGGPAAIEARQRERLAALLQHARAHSDFYAQLYAGLPQDAELGSLPPVTKAELMGHFDRWVTDPEVTKDALLRFTARQDTIGTDFLGRYVVFTTSGSTGEPTLLVQDARALAVMNGLAYGRPPYVDPRVMARMMAKGIRAALVFATGGHFLTTVMYARRIRSVPFRRRYVRSFSVLEPMPQLVQELNAYRPGMLESYASGLEVLAEEQAAGRLHIAPALVACGGEQLLPAVRRRIEQVFGCPLLELYSASEAGPLTLPCRYGQQHLNADWFILEPIDSAGRPVPVGVLSHSVLLTNLANFVQPLIRYELGDSVRLGAEPCRCGSPLPTVRIEGRTDEILRVEGPAGTVVLLPMALGTVVEETPGVHRFQVLQTGPATLAVRVEVLPGQERHTVEAEALARLRAYLAEQGLPDVGLGLDPEPIRVNPRGGKLRHVLHAPSAPPAGDR